MQRETQFLSSQDDKTSPSLVSFLFVVLLLIQANTQGSNKRQVHLRRDRHEILLQKPLSALTLCKSTIATRSNGTLTVSLSAKI